MQAEEVLTHHPLFLLKIQKMKYFQVDAECPEADWNIENYSPSLELLKEVIVIIMIVDNKDADAYDVQADADGVDAQAGVDADGVDD